MPIYRGCEYSKSIQFKTRSDGQPIDISVWQFESHLVDQTDTPVLPMTTGGGQFAVSDGPEGRVTLRLSIAETNGLVAGPVTGAVYRTDAGRQRLFGFTELVRDQD